MQPTSLQAVLQIAAAYFQRSVAADRDFLVSKVNEVRAAKWKIEAQRELLFKVDGCECIQAFTEPCGVGACDTFYGITLPAGVAVAEHLEYRNARIPIISGRLPNGRQLRGALMAELQDVRQPLKTQPPAKNALPVLFYSDALDNNKRVGVEYITNKGEIIREDVELSTSGAQTSRGVVRMLKIVMPTRKQNIKVRTPDGFLLGDYHPSITVPNHVCIQINGLQVGRTVRWVGLREPLPVRFDSDLVEWDGELEWKNDFMWVQLHLTESKTPPQQEAYVATSTYAAQAVDAELKARLPTTAMNLRPKTVASLRRRIRFVG